MGSPDKSINYAPATRDFRLANNGAGVRQTGHTEHNAPRFHHRVHRAVAASLSVQWRGTHARTTRETGGDREGWTGDYGDW